MRGPDPAPRRPARDRNRRAGDRRPLRKRRRASAGEFSSPQRPSASAADPETDAEAKALIERFPRRPRAAADRFLSERTIAAQSWRGRACALHRPWWGRSIRTAFTMWLSWERGQRDLLPPFTQAPRDFPLWCWTAARLAVRPALRPGSRITSAFPPASPEWPSWPALTTRRRNLGSKWRFPMRPPIYRCGAFPAGVTSC